mgnify:CR=1 FL=1
MSLGGGGGAEPGGAAPEAPMGAESAPAGGGEGGAAAPLSESIGRKSKKSKILGMLGEEELELNDLFNMDKAQQNIYEIENKIKEILND